MSVCINRSDRWEVTAMESKEAFDEDVFVIDEIDHVHKVVVQRT